MNIAVKSPPPYTNRASPPPPPLPPNVEFLFAGASQAQGTVTETVGPSKQHQRNELHVHTRKSSPVHINTILPYIIHVNNPLGGLSISSTVQGEAYLRGGGGLYNLEKCITGSKKRELLAAKKERGRIKLELCFPTCYFGPGQ